MDTTTCESCGLRISSDTAVYSPEGQLLCRACHGKHALAETEGRVVAARRRMRNIAIATAVIVIGVPVVLIRAGAGRHVATALMVLGGLAIFGGSSARRTFVARSSNADPNVNRGTVLLMLAGLGLLIAGAVLQSAVARWFPEQGP